MTCCVVQVGGCVILIRVIQIGYWDILISCGVVNLISKIFNEAWKFLLIVTWEQFENGPQIQPHLHLLRHKWNHAGDLWCSSFFPFDQSANLIIYFLAFQFLQGFNIPYLSKYCNNLCHKKIKIFKLNEKEYLLEKWGKSRNMATREIGLIEKKIDRAIGLIEQSVTRVLRTRENGNREIGRALKIQKLFHPTLAMVFVSSKYGFYRHLSLSSFVRDVIYRCF